MALLDTHEQIEELIASGMKKKQAEILIRAVNKSSNELVTKNDLAILKSDLELTIVKQKIEILKWIVPMFLTNLLLIIGLWFK